MSTSTIMIKELVVGVVHVTRLARQWLREVDLAEVALVGVSSVSVEHIGNALIAIA